MNHFISFTSICIIPIAACSKQCSPFWLSAIELSVGQLPSDHAICQTGNYTSCAPAESVCDTVPTKIVCCPIECLGPIQACYTGPTTANMCIPLDVTRMYFNITLARVPYASIFTAVKIDNIQMKSLIFFLFEPKILVMGTRYIFVNCCKSVTVYVRLNDKIEIRSIFLLFYDWILP